MSRVLSIDYGKRRVGLALSDPTRTLATGLPTLARRPGKPLPQAVARLVQEHDVTEVLVGMPLNMDGSAGPSAREVERFVGELRAILPVPVVTRDERLSTVRAWDLLRASGTRARAGKARVDRVAAALMLQDYLDAAKVAAPKEGER